MGMRISHERAAELSRLEGAVAPDDGADAALGVRAMGGATRLGIVLVAGLLGCGGRAATRPAAERGTGGAEHEVMAPPDDIDERAAPVTSGPVPPELVETLAPPRREVRWTELDEVTTDCAPPADTSEDALVLWYEGCQPPATAAYDASAGAWIVLDVDYSEGGAEGYALSLSTPSAERSLRSAGVEPAAIEALSRELATHAAPPPAQLVTKWAEAQFSLNAYAPLVELGGPLEGWRLWIATNDDLDHPEHVLWIVSRDGTRAHTLGRRSATTGPCDGGGYWCEATRSQCDAAGLRAEDRLCIQPLGIERVAFAEGTIAIQGTVQVAGHGGYPGFHWVARLPDDL